MMPSQMFWMQDEGHGGDGLRSEQDRLHEGVADEAADRLHFILDHRRRFRRLNRPQRFRWKTQRQREQVEAQATQHPLAERPLGDIDPIFESAVDEHEQQEQRREAEKQPELVDGQAIKKRDFLPTQEGGQREGDLEQRGARLAALESGALDRLVDDALGQIERPEIEWQRQQDDDENDDLLALGVAPDVSE